MCAWVGSNIGLRRLLVAVNLCSVSFVRVCVCVWIRYRASLATCSCQSVFCFICACACIVSLRSVSVVCVRALIVWIRYLALMATCSCQSVFCFSCVVCVCLWIRYRASTGIVLVAVNLYRSMSSCMCTASTVWEGNSCGQ